MTSNITKQDIQQHSLLQGVDVTIQESKGKTKLKATVTKNGHTYTLLKMTAKGTNAEGRLELLNNSLDKAQAQFGSFKLLNIDKRMQTNAISAMKSQNYKVGRSFSEKVSAAFQKYMPSTIAKHFSSPTNKTSPKTSSQTVLGSLAEAPTRSSIMKDVIDQMPTGEVSQRFDNLKESLSNLAAHAKTLSSADNTKSLIFKNGEYQLTDKKLSNKEKQETNLQIRHDIDDFIALADKKGVSVTSMTFKVPGSSREIAFGAILERLEVVAKDDSAINTQRLQYYPIGISAQQYATSASQTKDSFRDPQAQATLGRLASGCSQEWEDKKFSLKEGTPDIITFRQLVGLEDNKLSLPNQAQSVETLQRGYIDTPDDQIKEHVRNLRDNLWKPELDNAKGLFVQHFGESSEGLSADQIAAKIATKQADEYAKIDADPAVPEDSKDDAKSVVYDLLHKQIKAPLTNNPAKIKDADSLLSGATQPDYKSTSLFPSTSASTLAETVTATMGSINSMVTGYCETNYATFSINTIKLGNISKDQKVKNAAIKAGLESKYPGMDVDDFINGRQEINDICEAFNKDTSPANFKRLMSKIDGFMDKFPPQPNP